jgi:acetyl esterase/lipase
MAAKSKVPPLTDPAEARAAWNAYGKDMQRPYPRGIKVRDMAFPAVAGESREIPVRIYEPARAKSGGPCVFYLHGGAFIKGSLALRLHFPFEMCAARLSTPEQKCINGSGKKAPELGAFS